MRIIEQLVYKITGDNSEFDKSIDKSETKVSKFGSVADKMLAGVTVAAIGMVIKKMGDMVISSANALDRVDKLSQKIGLSRVAFQEWDYILGQSGASVEGLQMSLKTLSGAADEASKGNKQYKDSFDKLGVSVIDVNGNMKDQETLFSEVFSALADMENQTERTALASDLLGRSATELAPTLNTSKEEIEQLRKEAHDLGLVYSDELVDAGVLLGDNIDRLKKSFDALKTNALAPIIGLAVTFTNKLFAQKTATSEMAGVLEIIKTKTAEYKEISDQLVNTQNNLSDAERNLLLARKETLAFEIQKQLISLASSYNETKDNISTLEGEINNLNKLFDGQNAYLKTLTVGTTEYDNAQKGLERIYGELIGKQQELSNAQISYNGLISEASKLVADGVLDIEKLADVNSELYNKIIAGSEAYKKEQKAIEDRNKAIELAQEAFKAYGDASQETLERLIDSNSANKDSAFSTELVRLATEKLNEILAEKAKLAETEAEKEKARAEIIANTNKAISDAEKVSIALGDAYDLTSAKAGIFTSAIETLIESGLEPSDDRIQTLIASLQELGTTTKRVTFERLSLLATEEEAFLFSLEKQSEAYLEQGYEEAEIDAWKEKQKEEFYANIEKLQEAQTKKAQEELDKRNQAVADAYEELAKTRMNDHEKALAEIHEQAEAWIKAGVDETEVAKWVSEQKQKLEEEETKKLEEEEEARKKVRDNAYAEIEKSRMSDKEKAFKAIQEQADAYLKAGVAKADVDQWQSEQVQKYQDEQTRKEQEELEKRTQATADAYKLLDSYRQSDYDKAVQAIQEQADAFLEADVSIVEVEKWKNEEIAKLQEEQTAKAEEEAEKQRKAWEDAIFSMLGSVTSIWSSINQVQANQNDEEIQRIEEQNAIAIQAAKDRGASEEEVTELEKTLQADLNDTKNKYAQEEAERNKAVSTLSVILDTAKAIMQIWSNPLIAPWGKGVWTGLAAGAGAAQLAAINSAPVPSYDVGSIRIPETTQAVVHKDEMILTAPQAEQARREGITIAPTNATSDRIPIQNVIYLDGKQISEAVVQYLNSGSVGTIRTRVVK